MNTKLKILIVLLFVGLATLNGCYYDEVASIEGLPQNVSLENDVQPIFTSKCATSGCHDAGPAHSPSLTAENTFNELTTGNYINTTEPSKSLIFLEISSGSMPPSGELGINDQKIILAWITEGAQNN
jgi:hypothetical protein